MIRHTCLGCFGHIDSPEELAGTLRDCPHCRALVEVPQPGAIANPGPNAIGAAATDAAGDPQGPDAATDAAADPAGEEEESPDAMIGFGAFPDEHPSDLFLFVPSRKHIALTGAAKVCAICGAPGTACETFTETQQGATKVSINLPFCSTHRSGPTVGGCLLMVVVLIVVVCLSVATGSRAVMWIASAVLVVIGGFTQGFKRAGRSRLQMRLGANGKYLVLRGGCDAFAEAVRDQQQEQAYDLARALHEGGTPSAFIVQELVKEAGWPHDDAAAIVAEVQGTSQES